MGRIEKIIFIDLRAQQKFLFLFFFIIDTSKDTFLLTRVPRLTSFSLTLSLSDSWIAAQFHWNSLHVREEKIAITGGNGYLHKKKYTMKRE